MTNVSLLLTYSLVLVALAISYKEKLGLEREMLIGSIRAVVQLAAIGFVLKFIFNVNNLWFTSFILVIMVYNAAQVAAKRGQPIPQVRNISFLAILCGLAVTLTALLLFQAITYQPSEIIPISGMLVGNSMVALGLLYKNLYSSFHAKREEVEIKLCLGASGREAAHELIRDSLKTALLPTIDSMKTLGIVQLPGMMTGLILAGTAPETAIKYQIMVAFMLAGNVSVTVLLAGYWTYRSFFTGLDQLREF